MSAKAKEAKETGKKAAPAKKSSGKPDSDQSSDVGLSDDHPTKGRTLPGMEYVVVKPLVAKVKEIENDLKPAFGMARDKLIRGKDELSVMCHKYREHFSEPDESGKRVYQAGGIKITWNEKESFETDVLSDTETSV